MRALAAAIWMFAAISAWAQDGAAPRVGPFDPPTGAASRAPVMPIALAPALLNGGPEATQIEADGPTGTARIVFGDNLCVDSFSGLPTNGYASLILWPCHGYDNQTATLRGGALLLGGAGTHYVMPLVAPEAGCRPHRADRYEFQLCAGGGAFAVSDTPDALRITAFATPSLPALVRGAPVFVYPLRAGEAPPPIWGYDAANRQLRLIGTDLCLTPPSKGVAQNAPLYLDYCATPMQLLPSERRDDADRSRMRFQAAWR